MNEPRWLENRRPVRVATIGSLALAVAGLAGLAVLIPLIGAPPTETWLGGIVIIGLGTAVLLRLQPMRIGVAGRALHVQWPLRQKAIPFEMIARAVFYVLPRYMAVDWNRRYYTLHLFLQNGRRFVVGGLDGSVARELLQQLPAELCEQKVYSGST